MLSCSCDFGGSDWHYWPPSDFCKLETTRRKRCCSCNRLIDMGSLCLKFQRFRDPYTDIEERIWGDEVQLADWHLCEWCGEMYFNLEDLGYCYLLGDSMKENIEDYWNLTGFKPIEQTGS